MYYTCCDWCSSFINDFIAQKNIRKHEEQCFEYTGTLHAYSCWAYTTTFCISFLNHSWYTSEIELENDIPSLAKTCSIPVCPACLISKRPYIQAISFLPFSSPQTMVQDQKYNRSPFLCSSSFLHFRNDHSSKKNWKSEADGQKVQVWLKPNVAGWRCFHGTLFP